jgi:YD repeat-containing protein
MNRLIGRATHALGLEKRVPAARKSGNWLAGSGLTLLFAVAASAFAQDTTKQAKAPAAETTAAVGGSSDPQSELRTVIEPKYETDPTSLSPLGDDFSPTSGTITFSATDISIPGNFAIPVELRRWVPSDDANTGGPAGWKWNIPFIRGNFLDVKDGHTSTGWDWGNTWRNGSNCTSSADKAINNVPAEFPANL